MAGFSGKAALITGGGTGIGRATAELLADGGGRVLVCGRREQPLQELAAASGGRIGYLVMDVADSADRRMALDTARAQFGALDMLVNNAAASVSAGFGEQDVAQLKHQVEVNLVAPMLLIHEALPLLGKNSCVLNVTSTGACYQGMPPAGMAAYAASKAGLNQLTRVLATELGPRGIRVNAVAPGFTDTEIAAEAMTDGARVAGAVALTPLGRVGQPADVARVISFLLSDEAAWVTGQVIDASGGFWLSN